MSTGLDSMLEHGTIEDRINYLLSTIETYLDKVDYPNSELYKTISIIRYNMSKLNMLSNAEANTYKYKALNYLERLHHSFIWRYSEMAS